MLPARAASISLLSSRHHRPTQTQTYTHVVHFDPHRQCLLITAICLCAFQNTATRHYGGQHICTSKYYATNAYGMLLALSAAAAHLQDVSTAVVAVVLRVHSLRLRCGVAESISYWKRRRIKAMRCCRLWTVLWGDCCDDGGGEEALIDYDPG